MARWRRDGPRRRTRRFLRRALAPGVRRTLRQLQRAHHLMSQGAYAEAAEIFERLARTASRHGLKAAPQLLLQAGRAHILDGSIDLGMNNLREAMVQFSTAGQTERLPHIAVRISEELRSRGLVSEAEQLEVEVKDLLKMKSLPSDSSPRESGDPFPAKCPYCGGTVHPNEVEWVSSNHAVCSFCGSIVGRNA